MSRVIHFGQSDHVRIYGLDVVDRLRSSGFKVDVMDLDVKLLNDDVRNSCASQFY